MKYYKIYEATYPLDNVAPNAPDAYALRGDILDEKPKGRKVGYVTMRDGSVIECYVKFNPIPIILALAVVLLIAGAVGYYLIFMQPKDVVMNNFPIKIGEDNNLVTYNGFMSLRDGQISVNFTNGDYPCTIQVVGDGITCQPYSVEPNAFVASIPAQFTTSDGLVNATIVIKTDTSSSTQEIVVEIPENNTPNSPDTGLEGYWKGEHIYGPGIE